MNIPFVYAGGQEQTLKIGLVGCGGRGTGAADNVLDSSENVQILALPARGRSRRPAKRVPRMMPGRPPRCKRPFRKPTP